MEYNQSPEREPSEAIRENGVADVGGFEPRDVPTQSGSAPADTRTTRMSVDDSDRMAQGRSVGSVYSRGNHSELTTNTFLPIREEPGQPVQNTQDLDTSRQPPGGDPRDSGDEATAEVTGNAVPNPAIEDDNTDLCVICQCANNEFASILDCRHRFHGACIDAWMSTVAGTTCPVCRSTIPMERRAPLIGIREDPVGQDPQAEQEMLALPDPQAAWLVFDTYVRHMFISAENRELHVELDFDERRVHWVIPLFQSRRSRGRYLLDPTPGQRIVQWFTRVSWLMMWPDDNVLEYRGDTDFTQLDWNSFMHALNGNTDERQRAARYAQALANEQGRAVRQQRVRRAENAAQARIGGQIDHAMGIVAAHGIDGLPVPFQRRDDGAHVRMAPNAPLLPPARQLPDPDPNPPAPGGAPPPQPPAPGGAAPNPNPPPQREPNQNMLLRQVTNLWWFHTISLTESYSVTRTRLSDQQDGNGQIVRLNYVEYLDSLFAILMYPIADLNYFFRVIMFLSVLIYALGPGYFGPQYRLVTLLCVLLFLYWAFLSIGYILARRRVHAMPLPDAVRAGVYAGEINAADINAVTLALVRTRTVPGHELSYVSIVTNEWNAMIEGLSAKYRDTGVDVPRLVLNYRRIEHDLLPAYLHNINLPSNIEMAARATTNITQGFRLPGPQRL